MQYYSRDYYEHYDLVHGILSCSCTCAIAGVDSKNTVTLWSRSAEKILGYSTREILGKPCPIPVMKSIPPEQTNRPNGKSAFEYQVKTRQGFIISIEAETVALTAENNPPSGYIIFFKESTRTNLRKKLNQLIIDMADIFIVNINKDAAIHEVLSLIQTRLDIPGAFFCLHDNLTKSLHLHPASQAVSICKKPFGGFCYPLANIISGYALSKNCMKSYASGQIYKEKLSHGVPLKQKNLHFTLDKEYYFFHIPLIREDTLLGILHILVPERLENYYSEEMNLLELVAEKISAGLIQKEIEEELQRSTHHLEQIVQNRTNELIAKDAQLIQSEKLATLGEMAAGIAHEINQPLGAISLIAQGLLKSVQLGKLTDTLVCKKLESIQEQIHRIDKIIHHLRVFSRNDPKEKERIDINTPLTEVFSLIGQQLNNHGISVEFHLDSHLTVIADKNRLEQVFLNIIGNARDALDDHEEMVSSLKGIPHPPIWVENWEKKIIIRSYRLTNRIMVEIEDTGGGIPRHISDKLFEPFFTTKEAGKGTGLGLYISYGIIKDFGGDIRVHNKSCMGAVFSVILPEASPL